MSSNETSIVEESQPHCSFDAGKYHVARQVPIKDFVLDIRPGSKLRSFCQKFRTISEQAALFLIYDHNARTTRYATAIQWDEFIVYNPIN